MKKRLSLTLPILTALLTLSLVLTPLLAGPALAAKKKAEVAPPPPPPSIAGIYVLCERKNPDNCPTAVEDFRRAFPNDQTDVYIFIRANGTGFMAPDDDRTRDFTWQQPDSSLFLMDMIQKDGKKDGKSLKFQVRDGFVLRDAATGDIYKQAISDFEWNNPPAKRPSVNK